MRCLAALCAVPDWDPGRPICLSSFLKSELLKQASSAREACYESGGQEFESLRARQSHQALTRDHRLSRET